MALPANISTGRVEGQFIIGVADGSDLDDEPDFIPAQGTIDFTASTPYLPNPTATPNPVTMLKTTITGVLDSQGYLCTPHALDATMPGKRGLRLIATDDPEGTVKGWTWNVKPNLRGATGVLLTGTVAAFSMYLPSGKTVDLTTLVKVPSSPGIGTAQAEALTAVASSAAVMSANAALEAQTFAELAIEIREQALAGEFKGVKGDKGDKGDQGDQGDRGETGLTPSITIGEVLTTPNPADGSWVAGLIRGSAPVTEALAATFPSTMKGDKGDTGAGWGAAPLGDTHLDTVITPGVYSQSSPGKILPEKGYPFGSAAAGGRLTMMVRNWGGSGAVVQTIDTIGTNTLPSLTYTRYLETAYNTATPWKVKVPQRVDNTAGKAIYTWDDTANREQLIYGDTGLRDITSLLVGAGQVHNTGAPTLRREGNTVTLNLNGISPLVTQSTGYLEFLTLPVGFRYIFANLNQYVIVQVTPDTIAKSFQVVSREKVRLYQLPSSNDQMRATITWQTSDPWPTTLPGDPV